MSGSYLAASTWPRLAHRAHGARFPALGLRIPRGRTRTPRGRRRPVADWGMKDRSTLFLRVSDKVEISIHTVARAAK